ncbi:hypothetical protein EJ076_32005 [Mesorhizobium sp. M7D.F.Ca.US.005.01.1.1]|jgi:hypothetical protein|uniref:Transmembrane protein n=1 Tax=Rhizobium loti TaxID=381 RepID=A0A8E2WI95_RHILI|nr:MULTISPECIES: hypothetical protein [Mesorhizobium]AZO45398.1 hypothetical protein EJ076_32005 [Mesorhizobium sp. M7D.F.Ca.US.005.01.1.1]PWJ93491.1 hypothetical protein C8D77_101170 [Mesorhizobium loti]
MKKPAGNTRQTAAAAPAKAPAGKPALPETTEGFPWPSSHEIKKESNPFTDRDWRMLIYAWSGLAVRLAIIFTLMFSIYQFLANQEQKRVEQTMSLVELWENKDYQQAQRALKDRLTALNAKYDNLLSANPSPTEEQVFRQRIGIEAMTASGGDMPLADFSENFDRIVYFLNRLSFCVDGDLCSRKVTDAYFRDYAVSFWSYFAGYIDKQRKAGSPTFASAIEVYVRNGPPTAEAK